MDSLTSPSLTHGLQQGDDGKSDFGRLAPVFERIHMTLSYFGHLLLKIHHSIPEGLLANPPPSSPQSEGPQVASVVTA